MSDRKVFWRALADFSSPQREARKTEKALEGLERQEKQNAAAATASAAQQEAAAKRVAAAKDAQVRAEHSHRAAMLASEKAAARLTQVEKQHAAVMQDAAASDEKRAASLNRLHTAQLQAERSAYGVEQSHRRVVSSTSAAARAVEQYGQVQVDVDVKQRRFSRSTSGLFGVLQRLRGHLNDSGTAARDFGAAFSLIKFPAIGAGLNLLIGLVGSLAGGLMALLGALGPAVGLLGTLPGLLVGLATVGGSAVAGFAGIGGALKAYTQQQAAAGATATKAASQQKKAAAQQVTDARAVRDATRAVRDAREAAARSAQDSADRIASAEESVRDAQRGVLQSQRDLNQARVDARRYIRDLQDQLKDAALAEEGAALSVEEARARLVRTMNDPGSTDLERRQAALAVKEAEARLEDTRESSKETAQQAADAARKGVEGSDMVVRAKEAQAQAERSVVSAQKELARAQRDSALAARDSAEAIQRAQEGLADAQKRQADTLQGVADGTYGAAQATDKYAEAMSKLSPAAQRFVRFLIGLKPKLDELRRVGQTNLLPGVQKGLESLLGLYPLVLRSVGNMSTILGQFFADLGAALTTPPAMSAWDRLFTSNEKVVRNFLDALVTVSLVMLRTADAARPLTEWLSELALAWARNADEATRGEAGMSRMQAFFEKTRRSLELFGGILGNTYEALRNTGRAGQELGYDLLESLEKVSGEWAAWTAQADGQNAMKAWFEAIRPVVYETGLLLLEVVKAFARLSANADLPPALRMLREQLLPSLEKVFQSLSGEFTLKLIDTLGSAAEVIATLFGPNGLGLFLDVVKGFFDAILWISENVPGATEVMVGLYAAMTAFKGLKFLSTITGLGGVAKAVKGITKEGKLAGKGGFLAKLFGEGGKFAKLGAGVGAIAAPAGIVLGVLAAIAGAFVLLYKHNDKFKKFVDDTWPKVQAVIKGAWENYIKPAFLGIWHFITGPLADGFVWLWRNVISPVMAGIWAAIKFAADIVVAVFKAIWWYIKNVLAPVFMWVAHEIINPVFQVISRAVQAAWVIIRMVLWTLVLFFREVLAPVFKWLWQKVVEPAFSGIKKVISTAWEKGIKPIFRALASFIEDHVAPTFEKGVSLLGRIWEGLQALVAKPINFVIGTILNNGLIKGFNWLSKKFNGPHIDDIPLVNFSNKKGTGGRSTKGGPTAYAEGGVVPGYQPGVDSVSAKLSPGEGVLRPEVVRVLGEDTITKWNRSRGRVLFKADGGAVGAGVKAGLNAVMPGSGSLADKALSAPVEWFKDKLEGPFSKLKELGDSTFAKFLTSAVKTAGKWAVDFVRDKFQPAGDDFSDLPPLEGGKGGIGGRIAGLVPAFLSRLGLWNISQGRRYWVNSGYRSIAEQWRLWNASDKTGRMVAYPGRSRHNFGTAADLAPGTTPSARAAAPRFGLIFPMSYEPWHIQLRGFAKGGHVPGSGDGDTVPAMLTPGEFVLRKAAVKKIGLRRLHEWNESAGRRAEVRDGVQFFHEGGLVGGWSDRVSGPRTKRPGMTLLNILSGGKFTTWSPMALTSTIASNLAKRDLPSPVYSGEVSSSRLKELLDYLRGKKSGRYYQDVMKKFGYNLSEMYAVVHKYFETFRKNLSPAQFSSLDYLHKKYRKSYAPWVKDLQKAVGLKQTGSWQGDTQAAVQHLAWHLAGKAHPRDAIRPWSPVTDVEKAAAEQDRANAINESYNKLLDTLATWGLPNLVEKLVNLGPADGMVIAQSAVKNKQYAIDYEASLAKAKTIAETSGADSTKFVALVNAGPVKGIRDISRELGISDYQVLTMFDKLKSAGRLTSGSRTSRLEREIGLFRQGLFYAATGGKVPGTGSGDTVPAMLTPGEFVLRKAAVQKIGVQRLREWNDVQHFAAGGLVSMPDVGRIAAPGWRYRGGVEGRHTEVTLNTRIYNPAAEPATMSMNKLLRRKAALGTFGDNPVVKAE